MVATGSAAMILTCSSHLPPVPEQEVKKLREEAERGLAALEASLQPKAGEDLRLVGKAVTLADIVALCEIVIPWQCICSPDFMKP